MIPSDYSFSHDFRPLQNYSQDFILLNILQPNINTQLRIVYFSNRAPIFSSPINLISYHKNIYFSQSLSKVALFLVSIFGFALFDTERVQSHAGNDSLISHTQPISRKVFFSLT